MGRLRQAIAEEFRRLLPDSAYSGILTALAVGDRSAVQKEQWDLLRRTGTGHLMAISGLHIGLIATFGFFAARTVWLWLPGLAGLLPAVKVGALAALLGASGYALLAGMSLPTQRALLMIATVMLALLWQRSVVPSRVLGLALLLVLMLDPAAPLTGGFWLSFGAVAIILYSVCGRLVPFFGLRHWAGLQFAITLALIPATLTLFQSLSLVSPLANLVAIPWLSVTVVPMTLLAILAGLISEAMQAWLLQVAALSAHWLWNFLELLGDHAWSLQLRPAPPWWALALAVPGILLLIAPRGMPGRWAAAMMCLPLLWFPKAAPVPGDFWFTQLDVGQGLAAVIRTSNHVLVYDTGPWTSWRFDAGRAVLVPFLRQQGMVRIDTLIVSHPDFQHTGGVRSLLETMSAERILTSAPHTVPIRGAVACLEGMSWTWDDVHFHVLHPPPGGRFRGDNASCVLRVEGQGGNLLLPGDIEPAAERALLEAYGPSLRADVLVAPHHGNRGLSLTGFLAAVRPSYVLFSTGYRNRFGYPAAATVELYRGSGAQVLDTARHGAITLRLEGNGKRIAPPEAYREHARRYWNAQ
jgi:competence protein ComEC